MTIHRHGVTVHDTVGPAFKDLPSITSKAFPVYPDLTETLLKPGPHPDGTIAHVLATCAGYAYADADTVTLMMTRMGLENCRCRAISLYVDAMFIVSTAYIIQSKDGKIVILAYRGTETGNLINWLTDVDLYPDKVRLELNHGNAPYDVHAGFYRNFRATRFAVAEVLERALDGHAVTEPDGSEPTLERMEALYITGHSLGAAMAALMGISIHTEQAYRERFSDLLRAVYTFGQPMIGSAELADACAANGLLNNSLIRYIYQKDPVPHLPPTVTGTWRNFGREYQFVNNGWRENTRPVSQMYALQLAGAIAAFITRLIPYLRRIPFTYQLSDHGPQYYIAALTPPDSTTEFGDHNYVLPLRLPSSTAGRLRAA